MTEDEFREFNPKPGDVVHQKPTVLEAGPHPSGGVYTKDRWIPFDRIDRIERAPRPLEVGDRVKIGSEFVGAVMALHGLFAWVLWDGHNSPSNERLTDLERVDG
jgi:hypothetical protein